MCLFFFFFKKNVLKTLWWRLRIGAVSKSWLIIFSKEIENLKLPVEWSSALYLCACVRPCIGSQLVRCWQCGQWSVGAKREHQLQAAQLLAISAQYALHTIVPIGHPGGQVDVGNIKVRLGQRVRTLGRSEVTGMRIGFLITVGIKDTSSWLVSSLMCWWRYWCTFLLYFFHFWQCFLFVSPIVKCYYHHSVPDNWAQS